MTTHQYDAKKTAHTYEDVEICIPAVNLCINLVSTEGRVLDCPRRSASAAGRFCPLGRTATPLAINHQGQFAASTISFNLPIGVSLSDATREIENVMVKIGVPSSVHGSFPGNSQSF